METSPASGLTADAVDSLSSVNTQFYQPIIDARKAQIGG